MRNITRIIKIIAALACVAASLVLLVSALVSVYNAPDEPCDARIVYDEDSGEATYTYTTDFTVTFDHEPTADEYASAMRDGRAHAETNRFGAAIALILAAVGLGIMIFFDSHFTAYEQIWFITIIVAASVVAILFPEEDMNGVNGLVIMGLYLADTFLNLLCELLISKQSKWNFIVSVFVEITEILMCVVLAYRFATMAATIFFWLPIDIISFINWHKHPDDDEKELTEVRKLSGLAEVLIIVGIVVWTVGVGYLLTRIEVGTDIFGGNTLLEDIVCYLDACVSAVGVANGVFILFRFREQWIAWYLSAIIEGVINILSGQFVLLVLKVGYLTNTTYGYIKWTNYIRSHPAVNKTVSERSESIE